jgi:hypothetical protein
MVSPGQILWGPEIPKSQITNDKQIAMTEIRNCCHLQHRSGISELTIEADSLTRHSTASPRNTSGLGH